jgi:hypothetical protein
MLRLFKLHKIEQPRGALRMSFPSQKDLLHGNLQMPEAFRLKGDLLPPRVQKYVTRIAVEMHDTTKKLQSLLRSNQNMDSLWTAFVSE